jgi:adenylate kinase
MKPKIENSIGIYGFTGRGSAGKDTQGELLKAELDNAVLISTGDIVRGAADPNSPYYEKYNAVIAPHLENSEKGGLVPDDVMVGIVQNEIEEAMANGARNFIFTGFPRTIGQAEEMEKMVERLRMSGAEVDYKNVCLLVPEQVSRNRAEWRRELAVLTNVPIRRDDQPEVVERRLAEYRANTMPMQEVLAKRGELIVVDGTGTIDNVRRKLLEALDITPSETLIRREEVGAFTAEVELGSGADKLAKELAKRKALFDMVEELSLPVKTNEERVEIIARLHGLYKSSPNNLTLLALRLAIRTNGLINHFDNPANRQASGFAQKAEGQVIRLGYLARLQWQKAQIWWRWDNNGSITDYIDYQAYHWLTSNYLPDKTW